MSEFKRLEPLIEYMNVNDSAFGWKSRCEALTELAESLEAELADKDKLLAEVWTEIERKDKLIEQMREALLAARGIIEEGSAGLEADLLQPDKVIGQIDAVLQSITGGTP